MRFEKAPLGKYVRVVGGFAFKSEDFADEGIPVVRISDLRNDSVFVTEAAKIPSERAARGQNYQIEPGDILIAMSGATTGKIGVVPKSCTQPALQNQRVGNFKIIDPSRIYRKYLKHYLVSSIYQSKIWQLMVGVAQPNISSKQLEQIEIPVPPIAQQKRIAAILDRAEELRGLRRQALAALDAIVQSIFLEMFGDPVTNPKGWIKTPFGEICETRLGKMVDQKKQTGQHKRMYLRNANVQWFRFDLTDVFEIDFDAADREKLRLQYGDLLICEGGEPGRAAIWRDEIAECYYQKALHRARPKKELANSEYLAWLLWFLAHRGGLGDHVTAATIAHLTGEKLKVMRIPIPPLSLQQEFARRVEAIEQLKTTHRESLAQLDALFASLQHRAFRGELSP